MRVLLQRVKRAEVRVFGVSQEASSCVPNGCSAIGPGLVALVGLGPGDDAAKARKLAEKTAHLRIFSNEAGKFDKSLLDVRGEALVVSQFTLYGDCRKGRRPDFTGAMPPQEAEPVYEAYVSALRGLGPRVETGSFGAKMDVELVNDGPVTLWLES